MHHTQHNAHRKPKAWGVGIFNLGGVNPERWDEQQVTRFQVSPIQTEVLKERESNNTQNAKI